ncbi:MAG: sugar phosphate isomerase/epimerase [Planctomycetota bacterium]|nr:MAG: sugar phosphate isomerase/epimerase [Planctomycetota bacterium]
MIRAIEDDSSAAHSRQDAQLSFSATVAVGADGPPRTRLRPRARRIQVPPPRSDLRAAPCLLTSDSIRWSVHQSTMIRWSFGEGLNALHSAGIPAVGIWRRKVEEVGEAAAVDMVRSSGLAVSCVGWTGLFTGQNGLSLKEAKADASAAIRLAAALDAPNVCVVTGGRGLHIRSHARRIVRETLQELGDFAGAMGVQLCVHPLAGDDGYRRCLLRSMHEAVDFVAEVQHHAVRLLLDLAHFHHADARAFQLLERCAPWVGLVRVCDRRAEARVLADDCVLGDGVVPVGELVGAVVDHGYTGFFDVALWGPRVWRGGHAALVRQIGATMRSLFAAQVASSGYD